MPPSKRKGQPDALIAAVRQSRAQHGTGNNGNDLADQILAALADGSSLPKRKKGQEFEDVDDATIWAGVERLESVRYDRVRSRAGGAAVLKALQACVEADEDEAHWSGPDGELLDAVVRDDLLEPRICVQRVVDPFNPVALLTPLSEEPLAAVAAETIEIGEPIAPYLGDLTLEDDPALGHSTYLYELDVEMLKLRGYKSPKGGKRLRVDASKAGGEARFINDKWAPAGLPQRTPNCYIELIYDGEAKEFFLVFFASKRIPKGKEVIADYGAQTPYEE
jgi:hypothetical protein